MHSNHHPIRLRAVPAAVRAISASLLAATLLSGCFDDSDNSTTAPPPNGPSATGTTIAGTVIKGLVSGATVTAFDLNADGTLGTTAIGTATTAADGTFTLTLTRTPAGAVVLVAAGGSYTSEADGATVAKVSDLLGIVPAVGSGITGLVITPLSDMMVARLRALIAGGATLSDALSAAETLVSTTYGITTASLEALKPLYDKASLGTAGYTLGLVLGSLDTCDKLLPSGLRGALFSAISADFSDGVFDGKKGSTPVTLGTGTLSSTAGTSDFLSCVAGYAAGGKAVVDAGITAADLAATVALVRTALAGSPATPSSAGLSAGSSGAISSLAYGGKQWVFIAARATGVVAIDVTDPTATTPTVKVFDSLLSNFGGAEIGGVVPLIGADHPQLLVFAYGSKHVALVNADTGAVEYEADLALTATSPVSFSGGRAYIAGAIPDTGRDGVWLATADGYIFFDRASKALGTKFDLSAPAELAENVGADVGHGYLFAANYAPGVQLADFAAGKSYYLDGPAFSTTFPALYEPDAGSVDTTLQVGIITNEDTDDIGLINLKTIVKTDVAGGRSTFAAAAGGAVALNLGGPTLSGSAVDSDSHLVLFMAGYSTDIAVGKLQDPAAVPAGGTWSGLTDWRFVNNLTGYSYARDPHAVAVVKNLGDGKAYGYLLDGGTRKSFQVDMAAMLAAPAAATTGNASHQLATDPTTNGIVKSIIW
ncbi:hypothetical protein BH11PSE8_BH11PSE8_24110 [soil metagenome]